MAALVGTFDLSPHIVSMRVIVRRCLIHASWCKYIRRLRSTSILSKLQVADRAEAIIRARDAGLA